MSFVLMLAAAATTPNDYALEQNWLCRPGRRDDCTGSLQSTAVAANGALQVSAPVKSATPAADCFYVYPTVSFDTTGNSDMVANEEEHKVIAAQFARFASVCRTFAPLYRQVTLTALRALMGGKPIPADRELNYADVRDAWNSYLARDNGGRPYVLIGHSQGAGLIKRLVAEEIEGKPVAGRMLSAMILGHNLLVAKGKDVGGDFKSTPLCHSASQTGCAIAYVSFRESSPPPPNSRFGKTDKADMEVACTNPAALGGGNGALSAQFVNRGSWDMANAIGPWAKGADIRTPYVGLPGLLSGRCVASPAGNYLAVKVAANIADPRTDDIPGDVMIGTTIAADWGLHLVDVTVSYDNLTALVASQSDGWQKTQSKY